MAIMNKAMVNKIKEKAEWIALAIMALIIFFFGVYKLTEVGQPLAYGDEFGYWSNSSFFIGQDWSQTTKSINYYSYGYSLLLIPIRLLAHLLGWNHRLMFQTAVVMHALMLTGAFFIARQLCIRYMSDLHWLIRDLACLTVMLYPSFIVYAHMTLTETTLAFLFWVFFYAMMRMTDKPALANHIGFAAVAFYMYIVHQRCLGVLIASVIVVVYLRLLKRNRLSHVAAFFGFLCAAGIVHSAVKRKLQNDFYMAREPAGWNDVVGYALNNRTLVLVLAAAVCLLALYLIDKGKGRLVAVSGLIAAVMLCIALVAHVDSIRNIAGGANARIAVNDFTGQIGKVFDAFTLPGFLRLLISIAGKWFYIATASGLIICFAIWDLGRRFFCLLWDGARRMAYMVAGKAAALDGRVAPRTPEDVWYLGVFLAWLGTFGISAVYMTIIERVNDLVYGRYQEAAACFLFLYGFYVLLHDRKWLRHMAVFMAMYLLAAWLCQYLFDGLGTSDFERVHSVVLNGMFRDNEVPYGKVWQTAARAAAAGIAVCALVKVYVGGFPGKFTKVDLARTCLALVGAACIWGRMGIASVESYVIAVNKNIERSVPTIAAWINRLSHGEEVYFMRDTRGFRMGLVLQFYLFEDEITMSTTQSMSPDEEAFYVVGIEYGRREDVKEQYSTIVETPDFALLAPKDGEIYQRFVKYYR